MHLPPPPAAMPGPARSVARPRRLALLFGMALAWPAGAATQAAPPPAQAQAPATIVVRDPPWLPYSAMQRALAAFAAQHALAPDAEARFVLRPLGADADTAGLMLSVAQADGATLVPVMADGSFSLPPALAGTGATALALNRKQALFRWRPLVRSPGLAPNVRRLGDLRLECRMLAAAQAEPAPPGQGAAAGPAPCLAGGDGLNQPAPDRAALATATLVADGRRLVLPLAPDGLAYRVPLADPAWPDDALIALTPAPAPDQ